MPLPTQVPSAAKRGRGDAMQRQLSLQGSVPPVASNADKRAAMRRQSSEDLALRIGNRQALKPDKSAALRPTSTRPKPARIAWVDRKPDQPLGGEVVEVVARRCAGLPRPPSRTRLSPNFSLLEKDTPLTRQQLAERLRRAWRDREKKPNLDIILAHSRPESSSSARSTASNEVATPTVKTPLRAVHGQFDEELQDKSKLKIDLGMEVPVKGLNCGITEDCPMSGLETDKPELFLHSASVQDRYKGDDKENINLNASSAAPMTASERRASFRSSHLLNRTIFGSFSDGLEDASQNSGFKVFFAKPATSRPPLVRASSAPTEKTTNTPPASTICKPILKSPKPVERKPAIFKESVEDVDSKNKVVRKKLKNAPVRRKLRDKEESSDEEDSMKISLEKKKPPRRRAIPAEAFTGEVITMVSLVSPAESDVEEDFLPLAAMQKIDPPTKDEKNNDSKDDGDESETNVSVQKFGFRKSSKSVSFQSNPPASSISSFPYRRTPSSAPMVVPPPINTHSTHNVPQENHPDRGVKRRLTRLKTLQFKHEDDNRSLDEESAVPVEVKKSSPPDLTSEVEHNADPEEPEMKSPKEKECWALYKKMLDKGVAVSYETVLRGMLTPTEYRLRKSQNSRC